MNFALNLICHVMIWTSFWILLNTLASTCYSKALSLIDLNAGFFFWIISLWMWITVHQNQWISFVTSCFRICELLTMYVFSCLRVLVSIQIIDKCFKILAKLFSYFPLKWLSNWNIHFTFCTCIQMYTILPLWKRHLCCLSTTN